MPTADRAPSEPQAALLGVPYDGGATHHPGARFAPWSVREASATIQPYHTGHHLDVFARLRAVDGGNVVFPPFDSRQVREAIEKHAAHLLSEGVAPFVVGGDHSIALPLLRAVAAKHGPVHVLHFDAHLDTSGPEIWGEDFHHGSPLRHALKEKLIAPKGLIQVGLRASWGSAEDGELAGSHGARMISADQFNDRGPTELGQSIKRDLAGKPVYLTFDVDAFDPSFAPGTGTPEPGGLYPREVFRLLRELSGIQLVGMDVVEVCPARDVNGATSLLAAHVLFEGLALAALR
ncbi:MAG: agmatinase [Myxococcaceae bacterium]